MNFDFLTHQLTAVLEQLLGSGFELPIHFAMISTNGSVMAGTFTTGEEGLDCRIVAQHLADPRGFEVPINIMFTDIRGEAARVCIEKQEQERFTIQLRIHL
jgi:hypothetical protein